MHAIFSRQIKAPLELHLGEVSAIFRPQRSINPDFARNLLLEADRLNPDQLWLTTEISELFFPGRTTIRHCSQSSSFFLSSHPPVLSHHREQDGGLDRHKPFLVRRLSIVGQPAHRRCTLRSPGLADSAIRRPSESWRISQRE